MISCILLPMLSGAVVARQRIAEEVVAVGEVLHRAAAPIKFRRPVVRLKARVVTRPLPDLLRQILLGIHRIRSPVSLAADAIEQLIGIP